MLDPYPLAQSANTYEQAFKDLRHAFQNLCAVVDRFEGSALHIQANTMESPKFSTEVPMPTTSVASALDQQEPTKEHE